MLGAPIGQRPCRFTFEIEDHKIGLDSQNLPEMVVPMNSNPPDLKDLRLERLGEMVQDARAIAEHGGGNFDNSSGNLGTCSFSTSKTRQACRCRPASRTWRSRAVRGSGANAESSVAEANAKCNSAVCRPRVNAESR